MQLSVKHLNRFVFFLHTMVSEKKAQHLYSQGYRLVGRHSAVKACHWTKKSLKGEGHCYKQDFYDSISHQCFQMTPALDTCTHRCIWCWRDIDFTKPKWQGSIDDPKSIVDECIKSQIKYLQGFGGNKRTDWKKYKEINKPQQFAISLTGEPTMYPKLPELILGYKWNSACHAGKAAEKESRADSIIHNSPSSRWGNLSESL